MVPYMTNTARQDGINMRYGGMVSNTLDSHRLIEWAKTQGPQAQDKVVETLFKYYFEDNKNIGDDDVLISAAVEAGLDKGMAEGVIKSSAFKAEVLESARRAQMKGVSGVPYFIVNNKYGMSGAQEPEVFLELFEELAQ
eukprot:Colp12_sorted_trinity150504_noHs@11944